MPTHGSLTKAGKVRDQTPKLAGRKRRNKIPRVDNVKAYRKLMRLLEKGQLSGSWLGTTRRKRR